MNRTIKTTLVAVLAGITLQFAVHWQIVDRTVFDSDVVDDSHLFSRYYDFLYYYPGLRPPLLK